MMNNHRAGDTVKVTIFRNLKEKKMDVSVWRLERGSGAGVRATFPGVHNCFDCCCFDHSYECVDSVRAYCLSFPLATEKLQVGRCP